MSNSDFTPESGAPITIDAPAAETVVRSAAGEGLVSAPSAAGARSTLPESLLDRPFLRLVRWDGEKLAWLMLLALALASRVIGLGDRAISHDESLHALYSWHLFDGQGYQHDAMMHGPLKFIVNAFMYFIFGVNDWSARIQVALFGVLMVGLVWLLRPWLGRVGAFLAAVMFTISPALLFHSRYIRDEVILCALLVLLVVAMFRYLATRQTKWLIWTAAALGLALTTMEASFIFGGIFGIFLLLALAGRLWRLSWPSVRSGSPSAQTLSPVDGDERALTTPGRRNLYRVLAAVALPTLAAGTILLMFKQNVPGLALAGVGTLLALAAAIVAALGWRSRLRIFPELDLLVLLFTLVLPFLAAFPMRVLHWSLDPFKKADAAFTFAATWHGFLVMGILALIGLGIGWYWLRGRWLAAAGLFWGIELVLFTSFLTNGMGMGTGIIGSLGYWIDQQEVMRGGQPWFYFLLMVPLYEFLPLLLAAGGALAVIARWQIKRSGSQGAAAEQVGRSGEESSGALQNEEQGSRQPAPLEAPDVRALFLAFLVFWVAGVWVVFTYVGEKMPWHVVYFATPMALLGGWWLGRIVEGIDWGVVRARGGFWLLAGVPVFLLALKAIFPALEHRPFVDTTMNGLGNTVGWIVAVVVGLAALWLGSERIAALGRGQSLRLVAVSVAALLGIYTAGVAYRFAYINYDYPTEPMVYAHGTPDLKLAMSQVEEISRKTVGGHNLKIAYDSDALWPLEWYLRDYGNRVYYGENPSRAALDAPVVIVGDGGLDKAKPYLGNRYYDFTYRLIWWPRQTYWDLTWQRIWDGIKDPKQRGQFWDVVLNRRYSTATSAWEPPYVRFFHLFVRKDIADQVWPLGAPPTAAAQAAVDPYLKGQKDIAALQAIGTAGVSGTGAGQLSSPRAVAVAADGTVYVADSGNNRVAVFGADGKFIRQWGSPCKLIENNQGCQGDGHGQFNEPWGIAVGSDGSVYVADTWNSRVQKFDREGNFAAMWGVFQSTNGELTQPGAMYGPRAIAVGQDGLVYVMDTGNKRVQSFKADGTFVGQYGGGGVVDGKFDEPVGLAQDGSGNWYVTDTWNHRVQKFDAGWNYVGQWAVNGWGSQSVVNKPYLAVDAKRGLVYTTDPEGYRVLVFGTDGSFKGTWGQFGQEANTFTLPTGIAVAADGKVYVADGGSQRIMIFPAWQ